MTTVSCVIPAHHRAEYIGPAIESIRLQTTQPLEVIVVSDVVDDATRQVCEGFDKQTSFSIRYIEHTDGLGGASSSRNVGARATTGELIAFLDDDDLWAETYLMRACQAASRVELVVTWLEEFSDSHRVSGPRMPRGLRAQDVVALNPGATGSNMLVRRSLFEKIGGFDEHQRVKNDTDFLYRALRSGASYEVVQEHLVLQRKHFAGQLTAKTEMRARGVARYLAKHRHALTPGDVKTLRVQLDRIRSRSAKSPFVRFIHGVRLAILLGPRAVVAKTRRNHDIDSFVEVGPLQDAQNQ